MSKLVYVSAQPDLPYFHWQCEVYGFNFVEKGIDPSDIHMVFGMVNPEQKPSKSAIDLRKLGYNVHFYSENRDDKNYIASIKPYLISNWLRHNPEFKRYDDKYKIGELELIKRMTDVLGIDIDCLENKNDVSGGAQYIIKDTNYKDWYKIYKDSNELYHVLNNFHNQYPIDNGIQVWTAEMWSLLWNLWCMKKETRIVDELGFSWATDTIDIYNKKPILHMAGVQPHEKEKKFYKGEFTNINPIEKLV